MENLGAWRKILPVPPSVQGSVRARRTRHPRLRRTSPTKILRLNDRPQKGKGPLHSERLQLMTPEFCPRQFCLTFSPSNALASLAIFPSRAESWR